MWKQCDSTIVTDGRLLYQGGVNHGFAVQELPLLLLFLFVHSYLKCVLHIVSHRRKFGF